MAQSEFRFVLGDDLRYRCEPVPSASDRAAAAAVRRQRIFRRRWTDRDADADLDRVVRAAGRLYRHWSPALDASASAYRMAAARNRLQLDRERRRALGYVRPAPASVFDGHDGGVATRQLRRRRPRPGIWSDARTAVACHLPAPNRLDSACRIRFRATADNRPPDAVAVAAPPPPPLSPDEAVRQRIRRDQRRAIEDVFRGRTKGALYKAYLALVQ